MSWRPFLAAAILPAVAAKTALLIIDVQDCFLENLTTSGEEGSLAVPASHIIALINQMMADKACLFDEVIYSQDFHLANHISFGSTHGLPPFSHLPEEFGGLGKGSLPVMCIHPASNLTQDAACCPKVYVQPSRVNCETELCPPAGWDYNVNNSGIIQNNLACTQCANNPEGCYEYRQEMWTDHCLQTGDSTFPPSLTMGVEPKIVQKGINQFVDAYSAFKDNSKLLETELDTELGRHGIDNLIVVGIATDVCVKESVRDAIDYGYTVTLVQDATAAVLGNQVNFDAAVEFMRGHGASIKTVAEILATNCPTPDEPEPGSFPWMYAGGGGVLALAVIAFCMFSGGGGQTEDEGEEVELAGDDA